MKHHYRCNICKARNSFDTDLSQLGLVHCKVCGHHGFHVDKDRQYRAYCRCEGFLGRTGPIPHRPGTRGCELHPDHLLDRIRDPVEREEAIISMAWEGEGGRAMREDEPCPF